MPATLSPSPIAVPEPVLEDLRERLSRTLGYTRYFAQGGDWGALVTSVIGAQNRGVPGLPGA